MTEMADLAAPFDGDLAIEEVLSWLGQFDEEDRPVVQELLAGFDYTSTKRLKKIVVDLNKAVEDKLSGAASIWYVPVGYVAKSGSIIAYFFRTLNNISLNQFVAPSDLGSLPLIPNTHIVFLDDYTGSGHQASQVWENVARPIATNPNVHFTYAVLVAHEKGLAHIKRATKFNAITARVLTEADKPFSQESKLFPDPDKRARAMEVARKYGQRVYPNHALGYRDTQGLLGFFFSTPNNTLPIFWSSENGWKPLLPHGESFRDPAHMIGPPPGLERPNGVSGNPSALDEMSQMDDHDVPEGLVGKLVEEFRKLKLVNQIAPALMELGIEPAVFEDFLAVLQELKFRTHEKEPVSAAIIVVPNSMSSDAIGESLGISKAVTLKSKSEAAVTASWTSGESGALAVRSSGEIIGQFAYWDANGFRDPLLPNRYRKAAATSAKAKGLLFLFDGTGRVLVFYKGRRILTHKAPGWHLYDVKPSGFRSLCERHKLDVPILERVLRLALLLSDKGRGALLTLGDHEKVLELSVATSASEVAWSAIHVDTPAEAALLGLMSQDGATIISGNGQVIKPMTTLRPPLGLSVELEPGKGKKHETAVMMSMATQAITIAVSVDGRITFYSHGKAVFKIMG